MDALMAHSSKANEALGKRICEALLSNGYKSAVFAATISEALEAAAGLIPNGASVGIPGTVTARQIGLFEKLEGKGCRVIHHWDPSLTPEAKVARLLDENAADWFVTSSNAITYDGKMVNIDGTGNRVAAMAWGPGKILFVVGMNKAARDLEGAIARARDIATPPNAMRVGLETPCVKAGHCIDCSSPKRLCRVVLIHERAPFDREAHVILVGEALGY